MKKTLPLSIYTAFIGALAALSGYATAQTIPPGRITFDKSGCQACHAYSSRRGGPSVRDMLTEFAGEPEKALKAIDQTEKHAADLMTGKISVADIRSMAEWISGSELEAPEENIAETTKPATPPQQPAVAPPAAPLRAAPAPVAAPSVAPLPSSPAPVVIAKERRQAPISVTGIQVEPGTKSDRLIISFSGGAGGDIDIRNDDGALLIRLADTALSSALPETIKETPNARSVGQIDASDEGSTLVLKVLPREGELKHSAMQLRNRLVIELNAIPAKRKPAPVAMATQPTTTNKGETAKPSTAPAKTAGQMMAAPAPAVAKPETVIAKPSLADEKAKRDAAEKARAEAQHMAAKKDAEAKARRDAEAQALAKKEAEAAKQVVAQKKEAETKAKQEASESARKEAELMAALKASAEALKGAGTASQPSSTGEGKAEKRDRSKLKAPEKFRDEPCPPVEQSEAIATVDEAKAKDIIERVGCPQCHAFVQKKTGPPFKRVFEKVKGNPSCVISRLKKNKEHREEGVTDDLKGPEFKIVADYLATRAK